MENKSDELAVKRSEEIINACETLYETMKFKAHNTLIKSA